MGLTRSSFVARYQGLMWLAISTRVSAYPVTEQRPCQSRMSRSRYIPCPSRACTSTVLSVAVRPASSATALLSSTSRGTPSARNATYRRYIASALLYMRCPVSLRLWKSSRARSASAKRSNASISASDGTGPSGVCDGSRCLTQWGGGWKRSRSGWRCRGGKRWRSEFHQTITIPIKPPPRTQSYALPLNSFNDNCIHPIVRK